MNRASPIGSGKKKDLVKKLKESDKHAGSNLSGEMLSALDLSGKDFSKCDLSGANLFGANLSGCNFSSSDLTDTKLEGAHLRNCDFTGARRNGKQILKAVTIGMGEDQHYGFLCEDQTGKKVLVNESSKPEYEFRAAGATDIGAMIYNLLVNNV